MIPPKRLVIADDTTFGKLNAINDLFVYLRCYSRKIGNGNLAKRETAADFVTDRKLFVFVALVAGFSILGPFGTYEILTFWPRIIFWSLLMAGIGGLMHFAITLALHGDLLRVWPFVAKVAVGAMIAAVPSVALVIFMTGYFFETGVSPDAFPLLWAQVTVIGIVAGVIEYRPTPRDAEMQPGTPRTRLHNRLSFDGAPDILSLSMHDHYVEVSTSSGSEMVLMRLSDAIAELDGLPGAKIHRSHWAASRHMTSLSRQGRRHAVTLTNGKELPVSASHLEAVTEAMKGNPTK